MVSFICDACGQTVKKQKVEKHYQNECRSCSVLSCIDCGKDFPGNSYASHTSCISEAEKYQGKLYKAKDKANKGERKQQEWLEQVRTMSNETGKQDPRIRKLLAKITSYDNVPRKERKFKKFCENSINVRDSILLDKLWQVFSGVKSSNPPSSGNKVNESATESETVDSERLKLGDCVDENNLSKNETKSCKEREISSQLSNEALKTGTSDQERQISSEVNEAITTKAKLQSKVKKRKKRKFETEEEVQENGNHVKTTDDSGRKKKKWKRENTASVEQELLTDFPKIQEKNGEEEEITIDSQPKEKFKWESIIKKLLKSAPDQEMSIKKLRKKVLNEFQAQGGDSRARTEQELRILFEKKLHKNPKIKVVKERAKLCQ